jgi:serine/threonine-protein kinase
VQLKTDRPRALKVMHASTLANEQLRARFAREAKIIAGVESDHIVEIIDAGVEEKSRTPYIVMELLKGESLGSAIAREGRLAPETVITYLTQAAHALDKAHAAGIVHRDLKPENLFITRADDGRPRVKVLDFGIHSTTARARSPPGSSAPRSTSRRSKFRRALR